MRYGGHITLQLIDCCRIFIVLQIAIQLDLRTGTNISMCVVSDQHVQGSHVLRSIAGPVSNNTSCTDKRGYCIATAVLY